MKNISKLFLILFAGLLVAQCSTYSMKSDMTKNGVINKTPKWYVKYPHTTRKIIKRRHRLYLLILSWL